MDPNAKRSGNLCISAAGPTFTVKVRRGSGAFSNALGPSTRQMNGGARHDTINFVVDGWNTSNVLRQAEQLALERQNALELFEQHLAVVKYLSARHATKVCDWSRMSRLCKKDARGELHSVYQHKAPKLPTIDDVLDTIMDGEHERGIHRDDHEPPAAMWIRSGMKIERIQHLVVALLKYQKQHPLAETLAAIAKERETLQRDLAEFRELQRTFLPRLKLSGLDVEEPEITALQLPSYLKKHARLDATTESQDLCDLEIKLRCGQANEAILGVRAASLALSAVKSTQSLDYRGGAQAGKTRHQRSLEKANLAKMLEITMYNVARAAMIDLGYIAAGDEDPYPPLTIRDTRRKETHLHRPKGDSRRFDGTAWYLEDGLALPISVASASTSSRVIETESDGEASPQLLAGTQTLKRAGFTKSPRPAKRRAPDEEPASDSGSEPGGADKAKQQKSANKKKPNKKPKKTDGWIWLETMVRREGSTNDKMKEYREESDRVQWFRAEAEMYRWRDQYERKHAELLRVMTRFGRDAEVWSKRAAHLEQTVKSPGAVTYAREQAAMYKCLQHNSRITFKSTESAAHAEWVAATSFDDLVARIDASRDADFKWMDDLLSGY
ncbi:hypothetical protein B0H14DRAFT_3623716 [Mycena olivaceomarginata]|nr:hypothetical protein B0H14DRAFT_3623716 [Mycena olivaceomarginata]